MTNICKRLGLDINETLEPLSEIINEFDFAVSSHSTSASLEAYLAGLKVIIFLNGDTFNLSPLRGNSGVNFVSSSVELFNSIVLNHTKKFDPLKDEEIFYNNRRLPRWKKLMDDFNTEELSK